MSKTSKVSFRKKKKKTSRIACLHTIIKIRWKANQSFMSILIKIHKWRTSAENRRQTGRAWTSSGKLNHVTVCKVKMTKHRDPQELPVHVSVHQH